MEKAAIYLMRFCLNFIYMFMKLLPARQGKVLFLSRQSDQLTLDFRMVQDMLRKMRPDVHIVTLCRRLEGEESGGLVQFAVITLKSMYHMATSRVCVLDAYWPAVSLLHHKKTLQVIQMWHALGKIKQSGYQTLGRESGRSPEMARLMKMHENYDFIIAGGKAWNPYYCQSFNTSDGKLVNVGLPRIDHLLETEKENREAVFKAYPEFGGKTVILYAPTFRKNIEPRWEELADAVVKANGDTQDGSTYSNVVSYFSAGHSADAAGPKEEYVLIVKSHPNQKLETSGYPGIYDCPEFTAVDLLAACDYLITDYSAIALEGAVLNRPTYYFVYDYEEYREKNGMNIDLFQAMPGCVYRHGSEIMEKIGSGDYPWESLKSYREKYLPEDLGTSTGKICKLILHCMTIRK